MAAAAAVSLGLQEAVAEVMEVKKAATIMVD